jgi:hypothetical protein
MMRPNHTFIAAWNRTPMMTKLSIMAAMMIKSEQAPMAVSKLIALVGTMATMLDSESRVYIASQLRDEADTLDRKGLLH